MKAQLPLICLLAIIALIVPSVAFAQHHDHGAMSGGSTAPGAPPAPPAPPTAPPTPTAPTDPKALVVPRGPVVQPAQSAETYVSHGIVESISQGNNSVVLSHEAIPALNWEEMTTEHNETQSQIHTVSQNAPHRHHAQVN